MSTSVNSIYKRIALVGDTNGINQMLQALPNELVSCVVCATNRPENHDEVKKIAKNLGCGFFIQPKESTEKYDEFMNSFAALEPDIIFCNSYSMILRSSLLNIVNYNAINCHCSLLPNNRGANPWQWALIKGETKTGITLHYMADELDAGDIIAQLEIEITPEDTWVTLRDKSTSLQISFLQKEYPKILAGVNSRIKQKFGEYPANKRLNPESPEIKFSEMSDEQVYNLIRAQVSPLKGAYIQYNGERIYFPELIPMKDIKRLREKYG